MGIRQVTRKGDTKCELSGFSDVGFGASEEAQLLIQRVCLARRPAV